MFKLSYSRARTWRHCHKAHDYRYNQKLKKKTKSRPLFFGSVIHECLEAQSLGKSYEPILKKYDKELRNMFEEERIELGLENVIEDAKRILGMYEYRYENDQMKTVSVEKQILLPLTKNIMFDGRLDKIVREGDKFYIFERKTAKTIPDDRARVSDLQTSIYFHILKLDGFKHKISGIIWDYVRSKPPTIPEKLKKGGLSLANIDTLPPVYAAQIKKLKLDPKPYRQKLKELESKWPVFFRRIKLPFNQTLTDNMVEDMVSTGNEIIEHGEERIDRNLTRDCDRCEFYNLCQAELRGLDAGFIRAKEYEVRDGEESKRKVR